MSDLALARLVEITEAAAYTDLLLAAPSEWRCVAEETDGGWPETGEDTSARPNPSFRNMIRAGFTVAYHRQNFMSPKM